MALVTGLRAIGEPPELTGEAVLEALEPDCMLVLPVSVEVDEHAIRILADDILAEATKGPAFFRELS